MWLTTHLLQHIPVRSKFQVRDLLSSPDSFPSQNRAKAWECVKCARKKRMQHICSFLSVLGKHLGVQAWIEPSAEAASFLQILPGTSLQLENRTVRKEGCTSGWLPAAIRFCLSSVVLFASCVVTNELYLWELLSGIKCGDFSCFFPVLPVELTCVIGPTFAQLWECSSGMNNHSAKVNTVSLWPCSASCSL